MLYQGRDKKNHKKSIKERLVDNYMIIQDYGRGSNQCETFMKEYEEKLKGFIAEHNIEAEHLSFEQSCHSVEDAAKAVGADPDQFVKSICMTDDDSELIVAIVKGEDRASTKRVAKALGIEDPVFD